MSRRRGLAVGGAVVAALLCAGMADAETPDAPDGHAPLPSPASMMPDMSAHDMADLMGMNDAAALGKLMIDQLELEAVPDHTSVSWDAQGWYGTDDDKLWVKSEGAPNASGAAAARNEVLWDRVISRWWSLQTGVRVDVAQGPTRGWAAAGVQGLAPYRFDVEAALYLGDAGRTAARLRAQRDLLVTQRLILQPEFEADLYGRSDAARQLGTGLADLQLALRARYEIRREVAPYIGLAWRREVGASAQYARADGAPVASLEWVAGLAIWF